MSSQNIAILLFARTAAVDAQHKAHGLDAALLGGLNTHVVNTIEASGLDWFHIAEDQQRGVSFGDRFANAIQDIFDKGYDQIITVGNDTPALHLRHFVAAQQNLQNAQPVIGPSMDGGIYMLGLHKFQFDKSFFSSIAWNTRQVTQQLVTYFEAYGDLQKLGYLVDVDSLDDLKKAFAQIDFSCKNLLIDLQKFLHDQVFEPVLKLKNYLHSYHEIPNSRGSPCCQYVKHSLM